MAPNHYLNKRDFSSQSVCAIHMIWKQCPEKYTFKITTKSSMDQRVNSWNGLYAFMSIPPVHPSILQPAYMIFSCHGNAFSITGFLCGINQSPTNFPHRKPVIRRLDYLLANRLNKLQKKSPDAADLRRHDAHVTSLQWYSMYLIAIWHLPGTWVFLYTNCKSCTGIVLIRGPYDRIRFCTGCSRPVYDL